MKKKFYMAVFMTGATLAMALSAGWLTQGCSGKLPGIPTMVPTVLTYTPTPTTTP